MSQAKGVIALAKGGLNVTQHALPAKAGKTVTALGWFKKAKK